MRRPAVAAAVALSLALTVPADAKFGMTKTKVMLQRLRPAELVIGADTVAVTVESDARGISDADLDRVRDRVEQALQAGGLVRVVEDSARADATVKVMLSGLDAETDERTETETRYVKTGERLEWDSGKNKNVKKDVYGNKEVSVRVYSADGRLDLRVEVDPAPPGSRSATSVVEFKRSYKETESVPDLARSEAALEEWLIEEAGVQAAAKVAPSPDPVEAFLAVDKPLKPGNELAQTGQFAAALTAWEARKLKGKEEAARLHNMGVAHEALAYAVPLDSPEHRTSLDKAAELYGQARAMDAGEKYFAPPMERIQASLRYAEIALRQADERRTALAGRRDKTPAKGASTTRSKPGAASKPAPPRAAAGPSAIRNGAFDKVTAPWVVDGQGSLKTDRARGGVFEARAASGPTLVSQALRADLSAAKTATLSLAYRVTAGEARIRFSAVYEDASGRARTHAVDVTAGEGAGDWNDWSADLAAVRPKAARLTEVRVEVEGGTAQLDDIRLEVR